MPVCLLYAAWLQCSVWRPWAGSLLEATHPQYYLLLYYTFTIFTFILCKICKSEHEERIYKFLHVITQVTDIHHWALWLHIISTLAYRALHGSAPPYLASSFTCVADMPHRRRLRSASTEQLDVPTCRRSTIGGRAFPVTGAKVWNSLPSDVTSASSLSVFKNRLKTYLFRRCYETVWVSITFPFPSHYLPPQNSGPCNSFYCLCHFKNVYDDDDHHHITSPLIIAHLTLPG